MNAFYKIGIVSFIIALAYGFYSAMGKDPSKDSEPKNTGVSLPINSPNGLTKFEARGKNMFKNANDDSTIRNALQVVHRIYGSKIARDVERIYRKETRNFESGQYRLTYSPGMELHSSRYPFGWTTPSRVWNASNSPKGYVSMRENNTGIEKKFLRFDDLKTAMLSLAEYIKKYRPGRWYSTIASKADQYERELATIRTRYT